MCAQILIGYCSKFVDVYGIKTGGEFTKVLMDNIFKQGAIDKLISDGAQAQVSKCVKQILRYLCIDDWHTVPNYQHQNPAERRYHWIKTNTNKVLNSFDEPAYCWLLALEYVCFIMNRMMLGSLFWRTPFKRLFGYTPDISMIYQFKFYEKTLFKNNKSRGREIFHQHQMKKLVDLLVSQKM